MPTEVSRDEEQHRGPACYRDRGKGRVTVMCPYGHVIEDVREWAGSAWAARAAWGDDVVTCHGALLPDAKPYPFPDTFVGRRKVTAERPA